MRILPTVIILSLLVACTGKSDSPTPTGDPILLTIIGTGDVHGELLPSHQRGGLTTLSGYMAAVRSARADDGGAVLLIDAGDMWQGTLESNLAEGATIVEAYNALGYNAATIGNHEFDFGPIGALAVPASDSDDPRGALRQRATEAQFPILGANTIDSSTGEPVDWENVTPSTMLNAAGIDVGVIGLITSEALVTTMAANIVGLEFRPLAKAIEREATRLRADGADLVIVTAHAGSGCTEFDDPLDLSSCYLDGEIVRVANALPTGLVDHIIAGHTHNGMAHVVNGIVITSSYSKTYAFSRVDFLVDPATELVVDRKIFPPQINCPAFDTATDECEWVSTDPETTRPATYEGMVVTPAPAVISIAARAEASAAAIKAEKLGVKAESPFTLEGNPESTLANLFMDALLAGIDADVLLHNVSGGIRAELPAGDITYGNVFDVMPFDNQVTVLELSGAQVRNIIEAQVHNDRRRAGFSGMRVFVACQDDVMSIEMILNNGRAIADDDRVRVAASDFLAGGGDEVLTPAMPDGGFQYDEDPRTIRDVLADWFRKRGGSINAADFESGADRRWNFSELFVTQCQNGV